MKTVKNEWYAASIDDRTCVHTFEVKDTNEEVVCCGIAKWDGCMDFNDGGIHMCCDEQADAFAEILRSIRAVAKSFEFVKSEQGAK